MIVYRNGITLNILAYLWRWASSGVGIKVDLGAGRKRTCTSFDVCRSRENSWARTFIKSCLNVVDWNEFSQELVSPLLIRNQSKDMVWCSDTQSFPERTSCTSLFSLVERQMGTQIVKPLLPCKLWAVWRRLTKRPRPGWRRKRTTRGESDFVNPEVTW